MEYGEGPVSEGNQHTTFHVSAIREETETAAVTEIHTDRTTEFKTVSITYTRLSTESLSLMEWRHFFQFPTAEWT